MAILKLILFIALLVPVCVLAGDGTALFSSQNYLNLPTEDQFDEPFHKTVREALLDLDVSKRSITAVLSSAKRDENIDPTHRQVYKTILSVTRNDHICSKQLVEVYMSIMAQAWAKDHRLLTFEKFMNLAEPQKFKRCAKVVNREFKQSPIEPPAANELYHVLERTFSLEPDSTMEDLHEKLMRFSLTHHAFNATGMVEAAKEIETPLADETGIDDFEFLRTFWLARCHQFDDDPLNRMLNMLSVARSLSFRYTEYDVRFLLLNEYRRLCYEWLDYKKSGARYRGIEMNIRRLLNQNSFKKSFRLASRLFQRKI